MLGLFGGFALSKRSRADERRHAEADALDEELSTLTSNVDALQERTLSGTARPTDYLTTRQLAVHLRSKIPKSKAGEADNSLARLIETLGTVQPSDPNEAAEKLRAEFEAVNEHVSALATRLREGPIR